MKMPLIYIWNEFLSLSPTKDAFANSVEQNQIPHCSTVNYVENAKL